MPIDKLIFILVCVISAAGFTIWAISLLFGGFLVHPGIGLLVASAIALVCYIGWRIISERLNNKDDDHYDGIEK